MPGADRRVAFVAIATAGHAGKLEFLSGRAGSAQPGEGIDAVAIHGL